MRHKGLHSGELFLYVCLVLFFLLTNQIERKKFKKFKIALKKTTTNTATLTEVYRTNLCLIILFIEDFIE